MEGVKYQRPTMGKNFNSTNCLEYIKWLIASLTQDAQCMLDKRDASFHELEEFRKLATQVSYLSKTIKLASDSMNLLEYKYCEATDHMKDIIQTIKPPSIRSWADISEYDDIKDLIESEQYNKGSATEAKKYQHNRDTHDINSHQTSTSIEYLPPNLDIEGIYEMSMDGVKWYLPKINNLISIPPMFYFFEGNDMFQRGVYACISSGVYVQVPFLRVTPENTDNSKHRTAACKDGLECKNHECTFAHPGTTYMKLGITARCPGNPGFGDKDNIENDIDSLTEHDMRMMLMYSFSDIFPVMAWLQKHHNSRLGYVRVIKDLHICDPDK